MHIERRYVFFLHLYSRRGARFHRVKKLAAKGENGPHLLEEPSMGQKGRKRKFEVGIYD